MDNKKIIKVAFIDDHDLLRVGICQFLEDAGLEIIFDAANGKLALEKIAMSETIPDLCIVDVNMPVMNGFETVKALREKYPQIKCLAYSLNDDELDVVTMLLNGADGYMLKSGDPEELKRGIKIICNGGRYFSEGVCEIARKHLNSN